MNEWKENKFLPGYGCKLYGRTMTIELTIHPYEDKVVFQIERGAYLNMLNLESATLEKAKTEILTRLEVYLTAQLQEVQELLK